MNNSCSLSEQLFGMLGSVVFVGYISTNVWHPLASLRRERLYVPVYNG